MEGLDPLVDRPAAVLASARIPYAFGGALALAYWAPPRATADIDLNVFVRENALEPVFDAIESAGFQLDHGPSLLLRLKGVGRGAVTQGPAEVLR